MLYSLGSFCSVWCLFFLCHFQPLFLKHVCIHLFYFWDWIPRHFWEYCWYTVSVSSLFFTFALFNFKNILIFNLFTDVLTSIYALHLFNFAWGLNFSPNYKSFNSASDKTTLLKLKIPAPTLLSSFIILLLLSPLFPCCMAVLKWLTVLNDLFCSVNPECWWRNVVRMSCMV